MARAKNTTKSTAGAKKSTKAADKKVSEAEAKAKAKARADKLYQLEKEGQRSQRGRKIALAVSLFLNLTFLVTIYAIYCQYNH